MRNDTKSEIEAVNKQMISAFNKGDFDAVAGFYTPNAQLLQPHALILNGTQAIREFWQGAIEAGMHDLTLLSTEVELGDADTAYEVGRYTLKTKAHDGTPVPDEGKYVVVWKKRDRRWCLHVDIWNSDKSI